MSLYWSLVIVFCLHLTLCPFEPCTEVGSTGKGVKLKESAKKNSDDQKDASMMMVEMFLQNLEN